MGRFIDASMGIGGWLGSFIITCWNRLLVLHVLLDDLRDGGGLVLLVKVRLRGLEWCSCTVLIVWLPAFGMSNSLCLLIDLDREHDFFWG